MKQKVYGRIRCLSALALAAGSFAAVACAQDSDINNLPLMVIPSLKDIPRKWRSSEAFLSGRNTAQYRARQMFELIRAISL
jgi:hypothetical protein